MRCARVARLVVSVLAALVVVAVGEPASARPVAPSALLKLADHPESLVLRIVARRGLEREATSSEIRDLLAAGFSHRFVSTIVALGKADMTDGEVDYSMVDGVLSVHGVDEPPPTGEETGKETAGAAETDDDVSLEIARLVRARTRLVDSDSEVEAEDQGRAAPKSAAHEDENPFPTGASGLASAVFLPARFGNRPSSFGTTIVTAVPAVAACCAPTVALPVVVEPDSSLQGGRFIPIRTSRGTLWVPN